MLDGEGGGQGGHPRVSNLCWEDHLREEIPCGSTDVLPVAADSADTEKLAFSCFNDRARVVSGSRRIIGR